MLEPSAEQSVVDLAIGRREFTLVLGRCTRAGDDLFARAEKAASGYEVGCDAGWFTTLSCNVANAWTERWRLGTSWLHGWASGVALMIVAAESSERGAVSLPFGLGIPLPDHVNLPFKSIHEVDGLIEPYPSMAQVLDDVLGNEADVFWDWQEDEFPPLSRPESWQQFMSRMDRAFRRRERLVIAAGLQPQKRMMRKHAEWTARFQVCEESELDIAARFGIDNRDTVPKAIDAFARLIDLPLCKKPSRSFASGISKYS